ncbi:Pet127-domain-containing protein [Xylaria nigripes]|nr:Pet127-domain-containing protein [Xylaria nigripes]
MFNLWCCLGRCKKNSSDGITTSQPESPSEPIALPDALESSKTLVEEPHQKCHERTLSTAEARALLNTSGKIDEPLLPCQLEELRRILFSVSEPAKPGTSSTFTGASQRTLTNDMLPDSQLQSYLFCLPAEIRAEIWGHAMGRHKIYLTVNEDKLVQQEDMQQPYWRQVRRLLSVPLICRRSYLESINLLYSENTFGFGFGPGGNNKDLFFTHADTYLLPQCTAAITSLEVGFHLSGGHSQYYDQEQREEAWDNSLQIAAPEPLSNWNAVFNALSEMKQLRSLVVVVWTSGDRRYEFVTREPELMGIPAKMTGLKKFDVWLPWDEDEETSLEEFDNKSMPYSVKRRFKDRGTFGLHSLQMRNSAVTYPEVSSSTTIACRGAAVAETAAVKAENVALPPPTGKPKKKAASQKKDRPPSNSPDTARQLKSITTPATTDAAKAKRKAKAKPETAPAEESAVATETEKEKTARPAATAVSSKKKGKKLPGVAKSSHPRKAKRAAAKAQAPPMLSGPSLEQTVMEGEPQPANLGVPYDETATPFGGKSKKKSKSEKNPTRINPNDLSFVPIKAFRPEVSSLSYGLDRVLFNPGVYQMQDPRSRVYNFDPYLSQIMPVNEFDFNALKAYVTSSKDKTLISIAKDNKKKYTGSTSSMTSMLAHFHYLLSAWRDINVSMLSKRFRPESLQYTRILKAPAGIFLQWRDGTYAIDADKEFDTANILSMLGKSMEKLLTLSKEDYERYRHGNSDQITEEERNAEEAFHYTGFGDFMMRSQLDAYDPRMPGTGMFDLKTRAVITIRMDAKGYEKGLGYEIRRRLGQWESFEREYYDMIRSAFLKYSLQVRMGRMDGIFYISLGEMDMAIHGTNDTQLGDQEFKLSLNLLNEILNRATAKWPEQSLRIHFETRESTAAPFMYVFIEPTTPEAIEAVQNANRAEIAAFEKNILGLAKAEHEVENSTVVEDSAEQNLDDDATPASVEDLAEQNLDDAATPASVEDLAEQNLDDAATPAPVQETDSSAAWQEARQMVEKAIGDDELGVGLVREAIGDALEQSGILRARSVAESREYVDALIGALTGRTPSAPEDESVIEPDEEETVENEADEEVAQGAQGELDQDSSTPSVQLESTPETLDSSESQEIEAAESTSSIEDSEPREDIGSPNLEALKSLIMQMVREIDERDGSETDIESAQDDASKLKEFERILGRLISQSRIEQLQHDSNDEIIDEDAAIVPKSTSSESAPAEKPESNASTSTDDKPAPEPENKHELLALTLTIKNKINGGYVSRVQEVNSSMKWTVEYEIEEVEADRAQKLYDAMKTRRRKVLQDDKDKEVEWYKMFSGNLAAYTKKGRSFRKSELKREQSKPMHMVGVEVPLQYKDVFGQSSNAETQANASSDQEKDQPEESEQEN